MSGPALKFLKQMGKGIQTSQPTPLATTAVTTSSLQAGQGQVVEKDKPAGRGRRKRSQGETGQDPKKRKGEAVPEPKKLKTLDEFVQREGKSAAHGEEQGPTEEFVDPLAASQLNIFSPELNVHHTDFESVFLGEKTKEFLDEADLDELMRQSLHNHLKDFSFLKYLDQHYIPKLQKRALFGEKNKELLRQLREDHAKLSDDFKAAGAEIAAAEKERGVLEERATLAEGRAKSAEEQLALLAAKNKDLEKESADLKDLLNKERDEAIRLGQQRAEEDQAEKIKVVEALTNIANEVERSIIQQIQVRNPSAQLDLRGISSMYVVDGGKIYALDDDGEKAGEVVLPEVVNTGDGEPGRAEPEVDQENTGAESPSSTQMS